MLPRLIDGILPTDLFARLQKMVDAAPLKYGAKSNSKTDPTGHMSWKPLHDDSENLGDLSLTPEFAQLDNFWAYISDKHLPDTKPVRAYANIHSYGMDGYFHQDSHRKDELTCIIHLCPEWKYDWAGETVALSDDGKTYWSFVPVPNRGLIITSNMRHCARGIARCCPLPRKTFMFKVRPQRHSIFEALSAWLIRHGALKLPHKTGSLHDHLMRVFELLWAKKCNYDVCVAGGLHSIYGTAVYGNKLIEPTDANRQKVREEWGDAVEGMAFRFGSSADRTNRFEVEASGDVFDTLVLVEGANLKDQGSLDKWPNLKRVWERVTP